MTSNLENSNSDLILHKSTSSLERLDDNFCGAFQEHYEYLMDEGLIETCQHTGTQKNSSDDLSANVSYKEFLHQYNQIKTWLDKLKTYRPTSKAMSSYCEKYTSQISYEEILKRSPRRELLNEYACHLIKYHPNLKHDVLSKLQYLNKQWKSIESIITKNYFNQDIAKDLEEDLKNFELWLVKVEALIENLSINPDWSLTEIEHCLNEHKCLQYDIESHAKIINSVLKLSSKLKQTYKNFYENGLYLQNRWHCLWLKSLEWQCRLEQENNRIKKVILSEEQISTNNSSKTNHRNVSNLKFQETKSHDKKIECIKVSDFNLNSKNISIEKLNNDYHHNDDVIPFDESEYEKILTSSTATTLNIRQDKSKKLRFYLIHSRSLDSFGRPSYFNNTRKTMSFSNLFADIDIKPKIPTSLTESEISKRIDSRKKRRFLNHITNDLSYYYSLTDVKYYSLDDDEEVSDSKSKSSSSSDLSNKPEQKLHKSTTIPCKFNEIINEKSNSSSSLSSLDLSYTHQNRVSLYKNFNKSLSDYTVSRTRNRVFKRFLNRKYPAVKNRKVLDLNETGGNEADLDDNLEEMDDLNSDEYDYDNSHELIEYDDRLLSFPYIDRTKLSETKYKLNTTVTSAYDTCSNLSNEANSSSEKACRVKSGRSSSGNASGDFNDDYSNQIQIISLTDSSNYDNFDSVLNDNQIDSKNNEVKIDNKIETDISNTKMYTNVTEHQTLHGTIDETSTTNTDISDPHWDGYTSSPFYSNSVTIEDFCFEKTQPILPWDELFFELDPIEDMPQKQNTNHYTTPKQKLRFTRRASATAYQPNVNLNQKPNNQYQQLNNNHSHYHYYYHHYHHYDNNKKQKTNRLLKLTDKKDSLSSCECSSSNETTTSDFKNGLIYKRKSPFLNHHLKMFESELIELENIIKDSLDQFNHVIHLKKINLDFVVNSLTTTSSSSSFDSTTKSNYKLNSDSNFSYVCSSTFNQLNSSSNYIPKYNDLLAICHTNISNLNLIKDLIKTNLLNQQQQQKENTDSYQNEFKHQHLLQIKQQKLDFYLIKLDDTINKWEIMESKLSESKLLDESLCDLLNELKTLKNSVDFVNNSTQLDPNILYLTKIENLKNVLSQFEDRSFLLTDVLNKLNEQKVLYQNFVSTEKESIEQDESVCDALNRVKQELNSIEDLHKQASLDLKIKTKKLENLLKYWSEVDDIKNILKSQFSKFESELIYDCSNCSSSVSSGLTESTSSFLLRDDTTREELLNKNLNNKKLLDLLNQTDLDSIESNLTIFETNLNLFRKELFDLFKFKTQTVTCTDLESICSKYLLTLDQYKNEFNYLQELYKYKNRTFFELDKENQPNMSKSFHSIVQKIDLNTNKIKTNTNFNFNDHSELMTNIHLDFHLDNSNYSELKTSTPRYRHIEIENTISPAKGTRSTQILQSDKSIQTENKTKSQQGYKSLDSGIVMTTLDSTDFGSYSQSTPFSNSLIKAESSNENISSQKNEIKQLDKSIKLLKQDVEIPEFTNLDQKLDYLRKRNRELNGKIDEIQIEEARTQLVKEKELEVLEKEEEEQEIEEDDKIERPKWKFSFVKILFYSLIFSLIFVFFVYYIMPKIMPSCCDFKRDYLWFNIMTDFEEDENRLVPF